MSSYFLLPYLIQDLWTLASPLSPTLFKQEDQREHDMAYLVWGPRFSYHPSCITL